MTIHEFGVENKKTALLLHPEMATWDYFRNVLPFLAAKFHVIVPAFPGYDVDKPSEEFTSISSVAKETADWLMLNGFKTVDVIYGCSMGGAVALKMLTDERLLINSVILDAGITPYQVPWAMARLLAIRDYLLISSGRVGTLPILERILPSDYYSKENQGYISSVLKFVSTNTIWNTYHSCNTFTLPVKKFEFYGFVQYWYAESEIRGKRADIRYVRDHFNNVRLVKMKGIGHAGMALKRAEEMAERISQASEEKPHISVKV